MSIFSSQQFAKCPILLAISLLLLFISSSIAQQTLGSNTGTAGADISYVILGASVSTSQNNVYSSDVTAILRESPGKAGSYVNGLNSLGIGPNGILNSPISATGLNGANLPAASLPFIGGSTSSGNSAIGSLLPSSLTSGASSSLNLADSSSPTVNEDGFAVLYYGAAAVEFFGNYQNPYPRLSSTSAANIQLKNIDSMKTYVSQAASQGAKVIVLPEYALFGQVIGTGSSIFVNDTENRNAIAPFGEEIPSPSDSSSATFVDAPNKSGGVTRGVKVLASSGITPCTGNNTGPVLKALSCLASTYKMVLVAHMAEFVNGTEAQAEVTKLNRTLSSLISTAIDGPSLVYSTAVAFSETGELLGKHRKQELTFESYFDTPLVSTVSAFKSTRANVTFGLFLGQDMNSADSKPISDLLAAGITNFLGPACWTATAGGLISLDTATPAIQTFSRTYASNIVVASLGASRSTSGSAIASNGTRLAFFYNTATTASNSLVLANVPYDTSRSN